MTTNKDEVVRKLQQLIASQSNFQLGILTSSAGSGGLVTARLPDGTQVTAKAGNDCSGGECSLFRLEDGTYIAMSGNASQFVSRQTTTYRKSTPSDKIETGKYLKVLFSKVENTKRVFYIGGDRKEPEKIHETDASDVVNAAYLSCTGEGKDKWVVALALQRATSVTIWHITAKESEKASWTDATNEIYPLLTYNGFGMWSAGTFVAAAMNKSETSTSSGNTKSKTILYTVDRPSFVTGNGQINDVDTDTTRTQKVGNLCSVTIMKSGECREDISSRRLTVPITYKQNLGHSFWRNYYNPAITYKRSPHYITPQEYPEYYIAFEGVPILTSESICDPPTPIQELIPCPPPPYGGYPPLPPDTKTRTISGGYRLDTKSFLVNNGVYSDKPGQITCQINADGTAVGGGAVSMTTTTKYGYNGQNWLDRSTTISCNGLDTVVKVDSADGQITSQESRQVCIAVGQKANDRITMKYTQADNDRSEVLLLNGVVIPSGVGFLVRSSSPAIENGKFTGQNISSRSQALYKSEYVGSNKYSSSPPYFLDTSQLTQGLKVLICSTQESDLSKVIVSQGDVTQMSFIESSVSDSFSKAKSIGNTTIGSISSSVFSDSLFPVVVGTNGVSIQILSLSNIFGLFAEPETNFIDFANPYVRTSSVGFNQQDSVSEYSNYRLNVVRTMGDACHVFYDDKRIMVSPYPRNAASFASKKSEVPVLAGKFDDNGSFSWGKVEKRIAYSLTIPDDNSLWRWDGGQCTIHSTSAWF